MFFSQLASEDDVSKHAAVVYLRAIIGSKIGMQFLQFFLDFYAPHSISQIGKKLLFDALFYPCAYFSFSFSNRERVKKTLSTKFFFCFPLSFPASFGGDSSKRISFVGRGRKTSKHFSSHFSIHVVVVAGKRVHPGKEGQEGGSAASLIFLLLLLLLPLPPPASRSSETLGASFARHKGE